MPDTWIHELPMRWADLDLLNHVTNVVYIDYALEAQAVLRSDGHLEQGRPVRDVTVTYHRPTPLSSRQLLVRSTVAGDVLDQEVCTTAGDAEPVLQARIVTTFGDPGPDRAPMLEDAALPMQVRASDIDATGTVSHAGLARLAQEARIRHVSTRMDRDRLGQLVLGTISVQPLAEVTWRVEPYDAVSTITRVGRGSFTIDTALLSAQQTLFTSQTVLVGFDADRQVSRLLGDDEREMLNTHLR